MGTSVFVDHMSQPARALMIFIRMNKLPVQEELINLGRREQKQERYLAIYPLGTIPCLKASTCERAIFRNSGPGPSQLGQEAHRQQRFNELSHMLGGRLGAAGKRLHFALFGTKAQGQPASSLVSRAQDRAKVEAAMDWHHSNIRAGSTLLVWNRAIAPQSKLPSSEHLAKRGLFVLNQALQGLEVYWLAKSTFVAGDSISIADLLICTELSGLRLLDGATQGEDMDALLLPFPKVRAWMQAVHAATSPVYDEVHAVMHRAAARFKQRKDSQQSKL